MKATYLLPCSCGEKIPIEPRQAGQTVRCACGKSATAPTLLEMASLARAEPAQELTTGQTPPLWGISQRLELLGAIVLLAALIAAAIAVCLRPRPQSTERTAESIQQEVARWSAAQAMVEFWQLKKEGLTRGNLVAEDKYASARTIDDIWWAVAVVLGLAGMGFVLVGMAGRRRAGGPPAGDSLLSPPLA